MYKNKALINILNTDVKINKINIVVEITNKLLSNNYKELFDWWNRLDEIWQLLFYRHIDINEYDFTDFDCYSYYNDHYKTNEGYLTSNFI
jgi:hypothetical protein